MKRYVTLLILVCAFPAPARAVEAAPVAFAVNHEKDSDASIEGQLIYRLKEEVRKSSQLELVHSDDSAVYSIDVSTMVRNSEAEDPLQVIYAATLSVKDTEIGLWLLLDQTVGFAGRDRLHDAAAHLMVWIDENTEMAIKVRLAGLARMVNDESDDKKTRRKDSAL